MSTTQSIKKLKLERDKAYMIFVPKSTGLSITDLSEASKYLQKQKITGLIFFCDDTKGIKVVEK